MSTLARELIAFGGHENAHWAAARSALGVAVPSALVLGAGHPELIGPTTFGAIPALFARHATYATRLHVQTGVTVAIAASAGVAGVVGMAGPSLVTVSLLLAMISGAGLLCARRFGWAPVPSIFLVFAAGAMVGGGAGSSWPGLAVSIVCVLVSGAFAVGLGQLGRVLPPVERDRHRHRSMPLRQLLRTPSVVEDLALYAAAPLLATLVAGIAGSNHPSWAAVAAVVPLTGAGFTPRVGRVLTRVAGTILGVGVTAAALATDPPDWMFVVLLTAAMLIAELFIARHYALAVVGITPVALLGEVITTGFTPGIYSSRIIDTIIGVTVSLALVAAAEAFRRIRRRRADRT